MYATDLAREIALPTVTISKLMQCSDADRIWQIARRLTDYPNFMDQVISVELVAEDVTAWSVLFNGNELRWTERDHFDEVNRRATFEQIEGDLGSWSGAFEAFATPGGTVGTYQMSFDLGIPALAELLHPLAEQAIRANCEQMLNEINRQSMTEQADVP